MNYKIETCEVKDIDILIRYKLNTIFEYSNNLKDDEIIKIKKYVNNTISKELNNYKVIIIDEKIVGSLLTYNKDDGILLDEIYLIEKYRNKGIGTEIIKNILIENNIVYLWVYKLNAKAINLYKKLNFIIINETETRYYMKYQN